MIHQRSSVFLLQTMCLLRKGGVSEKLGGGRVVRFSARSDARLLRTLARQVRVKCAFARAWILERAGRRKTQIEGDFLQIYVDTRAQKASAQNARVCARIRCHLKASWCPLGALLGHLGLILGILGVILGPSWCSVVAILGHLGVILGSTWAFLVSSSGLLGPSWGHLGFAWCHLGASWGFLGLLGPTLALLGPSWGLSGPSWNHLGASRR